MAATPQEILEQLTTLLLGLTRAQHPEIHLPPGATAAEFAAVRFGGPTEIRPSQVTVGITPVRLVANNPRRVFWMAFNQGTSNGAISTDQKVTISTGVPIQSNGGGASMDVLEDGESVAWEWFAITGLATQNWTVFEVIRV